MVELRNRQVVRLPPPVPAVVGEEDPAVVATDDVLRVLRVDPHVVPIAVPAAAAVREAAAAVLADDQPAAGLEDPVGVRRIDDEAGEVERAPDHVLALVAFRPGRAAVRRPVERRVLRLHERVDDVRVRRRDGHLHAAPGRPGQSLVRARGQRGPARPAVGGSVEAAPAWRVGAVAAGAEGPALAAEIPEPREKNIRIPRVHRQSGASCGRVRPLQHEGPCLPAVRRLVKPAVDAVAPELARNAGVYHVAVFRVDGDFRDALRLMQTHVRPGRAGVGRLVNPVADRDRIARPCLAAAHPDRIRMRGIDRDGADRLDRVLVEDRLERRASVERLPDAAARRAHEGHRLPTLVSRGDRGDPAAHDGRADIASREARDHPGIENRRRRGCLRTAFPDGLCRCTRTGGDGAGRGRSGRWKAEKGILGGDVRLGPLDREARFPGRALGPGLDREGQPDALDLHVAADVGLGEVGHAADAALGDDADLEPRVGVEVERLHVPVLERHAQLVGRRPVHVLGPEVLHAMALLAMVHERPVEVRGLRQRLRVIGRRPLRIAAPAEGVQAPALLAVPGLDARQALERVLRADHSAPLLQLPPFGCDAAVAAPVGRLPREAKRRDRLQVRCAPARLDGPRDDVVGGQGHLGFDS